MTFDMRDRIEAKLRKFGVAAEPSHGNTLANILAAKRRKKAEGKSAKGRKPSPPRLVIVGDSIKIRYLGKDKETGVVLRPGMDVDEALAAADLELDDFIADRNREDELVIAPLDKALADINTEWIDHFEETTSEGITKQRRKFAAVLKRDFPAALLRDVQRKSGTDYINKMLAGITDSDKRERTFNRCVTRLHTQARAMEHYYDNLHSPVTERRRYDIPMPFGRINDFSFTYDQFMRLLKAAQGWKWNAETGDWEWDFDADLLVVERYIYIYFYSGTRDETILPLEWGVNFESGSIDADNGIILRKPYGTRKTNKRAEPARLLPPLRDKAREWEKEDFENNWINVLHDVNGNAIEDMTSRFNAVKKKAGMEWCRCHDLKHTGVTWMLYAGLDINVLASAMSTTARTLMKQYAHLLPLMLLPKTSTIEPDLSLEALEKVAPKSSEAWKLRAARHAAKKEADRIAKIAKRKADSVGETRPTCGDVAHVQP
jgi:integrase